MSIEDASSGAPEAREVLTDAEERFERWRKTVGLFLGPLVATVLYLLPLPGLSPQAHDLAAVMGWVVTYWVTEPIPIPVTALLGPALCVLAGIGTAANVLAPFAHPVIFLFIGSFLLAKAMMVHHLDRRIAFRILSIGRLQDSPALLLFAVGAITATISMWVSNTATTAMMFPIALGLLRAVGLLPAMASYGTAMMLMTAYAASVGGIATIIGTPPNLIGVGMIHQQIGRSISFMEWMTFGIPLVIVMFLVLFGLLLGLHPTQRVKMQGVRDYIREQRDQFGPWTWGQIHTALAFGVAVTLWILPGFLALLYGTGSAVYQWYDHHLPEGVVALLASALLFLLPVDWRERRFTLSWKEAAAIDWGTILLFGGGLSLGDLMFKTGLSEAIGRGMMEALALHSLWGITALAVFLGIALSELTSNTASANMVIPVAIAIARSAGVSPLPPALGACLGASYGFMLPISTPPNAIVYGSGLVPITRMIRAGILFDVLGFFIIWLGLRVLCPLLGLL